MKPGDLAVLVRDQGMTYSPLDASDGYTVREVREGELVLVLAAITTSSKAHPVEALVLTHDQTFGWVYDDALEAAP